MRVALYARISSNRQREEQTIESQVAALGEFAAAQGWSLDQRHRYVDNGASGFYFDRPALDRLRDAARDGLIDLLLIHDPDRLARKYAYQVLLLEEFQRWNVAVRFLKQPPPDSPDQKLLVQIQGAIAEYERARIMERTRRGRLFWARQGRPVSAKVPYGYRYVSRQNTEPSRVEVDETEAVVARIFHLCAHEQINCRQIAMRLTEAKVPTPTGKSAHWDPSTVRFILRDESYLGAWQINKHRKEVAPEKRRPRIVTRPREEWIPIALPVLVEPELFARAQQTQQLSNRGPKPLRYPRTHLLRRLVVCKSCGRKMSCLNSRNGGQVHPYYWCRGSDPHRITGHHAPCPHPTVSTDRLDDLVWSDVESLLTNPELLLAGWQEQHGREGIYPAAVADEEIRRLKKQLAEVIKQRQRILIAYEQGAIELAELVSRRELMEVKIGELQRLVESIRKEGEQTADLADLGRNISEICGVMATRLDSLGREQKMELCRELIEQVVVDAQNIEIHYRFPVSGNCHNSGERAGLLLQGAVFLYLLPHQAGRSLHRVAAHDDFAAGTAPADRAHDPQDAARDPCDPHAPGALGCSQSATAAGICKRDRGFRVLPL